MTSLDHDATQTAETFGGRYVSELLMPALAELDGAIAGIMPTATYTDALDRELRDWAGRPTPLCCVEHFGKACGINVLLKREDLLHGGAHKTNNVVGQALLAQAMGKKRLIAETGAGQHGVATAMAGARYGMETVIYMGARDAERQAPNVARMELCGAEVVRVGDGSGTLKDAINEALRDWATTLGDSHYLLGTVCGPSPFPDLVASLHAVIGREARAQCLEQTGALPDAVAACVGGGSNAIGMFRGFLDDDVDCIGVEPGGAGTPDAHGAPLSFGSPGLLHGARTMVLQDADGQIRASHSVAAGLDYPGVGPEHARLAAAGRARYVTVDDEAAVAAFEQLSRTEGLIPALESAHALAFASRAVARGLMREGQTLCINLSGRGDKDLPAYLRAREDARPTASMDDEVTL